MGSKMKRGGNIDKRNTLFFNSVFFLLVIFSCGLSEIGKIDEVSVIAHPKIILPVAYGTIDIKTLNKYLTSGDSIIPTTNDGYLSFEQVFTEVSIPDTFAFEGSLFDKLSDMELRIETYNHLPMGIDLHLNFVDTLTFETLGDPINCSILKPAVIDKDGKVIATTHYIENTLLPESQFPFYQKANAIIMIVHLYTPDSENHTIYININDFLTLNIGMAIQISTSE